MFNIKNWGCLLRYRVKILRAYPRDAIIGICGTILWHLPNFVLIQVIFMDVEQIDYSQGYLMLLYGLSVFGDGVQHMFAEALWQFGNTFIKNAKYDEILIKPASNLTQVLTSRFDVDGLGGVLWGMACCFYGMKLLELLSLLGGLKLLIAMFCSACIFLGINIGTSSLAFLFYDNFFITHTVFEFHKFARFPKKIYPNILTGFLTFIVPVFGATYYPVNIILHLPIIWLCLFAAGVVAFLHICIKFWNICSTFYHSSGS